MHLNQYENDCSRFAELVEKFTGAPAQKVSECIIEYGAKGLLDKAGLFCESPEQHIKLNSMYEAMSLSMQLKSLRPSNTYTLSCPNKAMMYHINYLRRLPDDRERIVATYVDSHLKVISSAVVAEGGLAFAALSGDRIPKDALALNASGVFMAHNHPSGGLEPSNQDEHITESTKGALELLGKKLLDHIIVSQDRAFSIMEWKECSFSELEQLVADRERPYESRQFGQLSKDDYMAVIAERRGDVKGADSEANMRKAPAIESR
jgi:DNA repair protein RadC